MTRFRTIEVSDVKADAAGLQFVTIKSPALKARGDYCIYVPGDLKASENKDLPIVILLHGVYGSNWCWALKGNAHTTLQEMIDQQLIKPMILLMPSDGLWGDGSGYLKHNQKDFENWIINDIIESAKEIISTPMVTDDSAIFISGLSMGGYGALRLGAKHPQLFSGFSGHSSITDFKQLGLFVEEPLAEYNLADTQEAEVFYWLEKNKDNLPPFRFDCGKLDLLISYNQALHTKLTAANIPHDYHEFEGDHTWPYWQTHIKDTYTFFSNLS